MLNSTRTQKSIIENQTRASRVNSNLNGNCFKNPAARARVRMGVEQIKQRIPTSNTLLLPAYYRLAIST